MGILKLNLYFLCFLMLSCAAGIYPQTKSLKPLNPHNVQTVFESGKSKTYYQLQQRDPSIILIKGPGKLRVVTSTILRTPDEKATYSILYSIDGGEYVKAGFSNITKSNKAKLRNNSAGIAGTLKILDIDLIPGDHSVEFKSGNDTRHVLANYSFKKIRVKKLKWVMLSPAPSGEPVDLVTRENVFHYYRFSQKKPLKIRINGPTVLRILTRFENHYNMKGRIDYRIQLKENGKIVHTYLLSSKYSEVTTYRRNNKLIPGKAREFYIQVPRGKHIYTIVPLDRDKNTILARVLFPKKDVKLEE